MVSSRPVRWLFISVVSSGIAMLACGGTVASEQQSADTMPADTADAGAADTGPTARPDGAAGTVRCGTATCTATQVCGAHADGATECYERGSEPIAGRSPWPWPTVLLYCDGDDDCVGGTRCIMMVGEIFRASCLPETGSCAMHAGHLCSTDSDCHTCPNPGDPDRKYTCRPQMVSGAKHLHACSP